MTLGCPRSGTVWGFKGQGHTVSKFILHTRSSRTAIHRHSLGGVTSRLWFRGCLARASLTFARWRRRGFEIGIECLVVDHHHHYRCIVKDCCCVIPDCPRWTPRCYLFQAGISELSFLIREVRSSLPSSTGFKPASLQ